MARKDETQVKYTGDWSADSKLSAITSGYWEDPYFHIFNKTDPCKIRRTSLISRGYFVRYRLCDYFLRKTIKSISEPIQIVSLGCGMDTVYFRLLPHFKKENDLIGFFDVDFETVISEKSNVIMQNEGLSTMAKRKLVLVSCDLRNTASLGKALEKAGFRSDLETLFYSECVVNYLLPEESKNILCWILKNVPFSTWLAYEQCNASDPFGKIMVNHFSRNGWPLHSLLSASTTRMQRRLLTSVGFEYAISINAWDAFLRLCRLEQSFFPSSDNKNYMFDEFESLLATCRHYSIRLATTRKKPSLNKFINEFLQSSGIRGRRLVYKKFSDFNCFLPTNAEILPQLSGQKSCRVSPNITMTVGGAGKDSKRMKHLILTEYSSVDKEVLGHTYSKTVGEDPLYERMYSSVVSLDFSTEAHNLQDKFLFIFGGRKAPNVPCSNDLIKLCLKIKHRKDLHTCQTSMEKSLLFDQVFSKSKPSKLQISVETSKIKSAEGPCPRWRHAMAPYVPSPQKSLQIIIFGGLNQKGVLGDLWRLNLCSETWNCLYSEMEPSSELIPSPRHSHVMVSSESNDAIYLVGGVSSNNVELCQDSFWVYENEKWRNIPTLTEASQRIGHDCVVVGKNLFIIGGYGSSWAYNLFLSFIHVQLDTFKFKPYVISMSSDPSIFLPFGFSTSIVEHNGSIYLFLFGGGGSCFSFGSHYNQHTIKLRLDHLLTHKSRPALSK